MTKYTHAQGSVLAKKENSSRKPVLYVLLAICFLVVLVTLLHSNYHQSDVLRVLENMQGKELQLQEDGLSVSASVFTSAMLRGSADATESTSIPDSMSSLIRTTRDTMEPVISAVPRQLEVPIAHVKDNEQNIQAAAVAATSNPSIRLVSLDKPVQSSVRGNLGPASVITSEKMDDWLADRWQAAKNMNGEPIPGAHWVEIDLLESYWLRKFLIDWETAYSKYWTIQVKEKADEEWKLVCSGTDSKLRERSKQHVVQEVQLAGNHDNIVDEEHVLKSVGDRSLLPALQSPVRFVRLHISMPSTQWGSSIWRFQVWGYQL